MLTQADYLHAGYVVNYRLIPGQINNITRKFGSGYIYYSPCMRATVKSNFTKYNMLHSGRVKIKFTTRVEIYVYNIL